MFYKTPYKTTTSCLSGVFLLVAKAAQLAEISPQLLCLGLPAT